jgi:tetratricopeptide (TPR) repeat protein
LHKFRKETPLQAHQNTQLKQGWEFNMDISFETPDFNILNELMDKESQKNIDGQDNPRVKELLKEIKSSKDNYEIIQLCARVHELDPDNFKIFVDQAVAFQNLKQYEKANESFQIAIVAATKTDYDNEKILEKSIQDRETGYDKKGYDRDGYDRVIRACRRPSWKEDSTKYPNSAEVLSKLLEQKKGTPGFVFTMYAIFLMSQDELDVALEYCDKAIKIPKNYVKRLSLHVKGKILCQVGQYQKALECVDESLDMRYDEDVKKTRDMIVKEQNQFK